MFLLKQYLLNHGVKPSFQRLAVMDYLFKHKTHPTADEIYNALLPKLPTLSKTTVYNTLRLLADSGAALALDIDSNGVRYDGDTSPHAHFKCLECGAVHDLRLDLNDLVDIKNLDGFEITHAQLYFKGYCPDCGKNNASKQN